MFFLVYAELFFLCGFVFEMVIRMYALGPNYFDSGTSSKYWSNSTFINPYRFSVHVYTK